MSFRNRVLVGVGTWIALIAVLAAAFPLAMRDRLPEPMASHWGPGGQPDDAMPFAAFLAVSCGVWGIFVLCGLMFTVRGGIDRRPQRVSMAVLLAVGGVITLGASWTSVLANLDAAHWKHASSMTWPMLAVLGACIPAGLLGWLVARPGPDERAAKSDRNAPQLRLKSDERVTWVSVASNSPLRWLGIASGIIVVGALLIFDREQLGWVFFLGVGTPGLIVFALSSVRVHVHEQGVRIAFGPQRWPTRRVPLDRLTGAYAEERYPSQVGGWGYRGWPSAATIMIRGGECLILNYRSGGELGISVDDAERGAALINSLVAEHAATTGGQT